MVKGLGWKVVFWIDRDWALARHKRDRGRGVERVRHVFGQRDARTAWHIYWALRGKPHVDMGPELWCGRKRVL